MKRSNPNKKFQKTQPSSSFTTKNAQKHSDLFRITDEIDEK